MGTVPAMYRLLAHYAPTPSSLYLITIRMECCTTQSVFRYANALLINTMNHCSYCYLWREKTSWSFVFVGIALMANNYYPNDTSIFFQYMLAHFLAVSISSISSTVLWKTLFGTQVKSDPSTGKRLTRATPSPVVFYLQVMALTHWRWKKT